MCEKNINKFQLRNDLQTILPLVLKKCQGHQKQGKSEKLVITRSLRRYDD